MARLSQKTDFSETIKNSCYNTTMRPTRFINLLIMLICGILVLPLLARSFVVCVDGSTCPMIDAANSIGKMPDCCKPVNCPMHSQTTETRCIVRSVPADSRLIQNLRVTLPDLVLLSIAPHETKTNQPSDFLRFIAPPAEGPVEWQVTECRAPRAPPVFA